MKLPDHEFIAPGTLSETHLAMQNRQAQPGGVRLIAGGTDVVFNMRGRLFQPSTLLSIRRLSELKGISLQENGHLRIGAGERLKDIEKHPLVASGWPALGAACRAVASLHVRNMATLGGNLCLETRCWYTNQSSGWRSARDNCFKTGGSICHVIKSSPICVAINNSDTPPILIVLGARVWLESADGARDVPIGEFFQDDGINFSVKAPDEIVTHVTVPATSDRIVFLKQTGREGIDFSFATIAARAEAGGAIDLILGSLGSAPIKLKEPAEIVSKSGLTDVAIAAAVDATREELGNLNNLFSPAVYKRDIARALVRRALEQLREP